LRHDWMHSGCTLRVFRSRPVDANTVFCMICSLSKLGGGDAGLRLVTLRVETVDTVELLLAQIGESVDGECGSLVLRFFVKGGDHFQLVLEVSKALSSLCFSLVRLVVGGGEGEELLHDLHLGSGCKLGIHGNLGKEFLDGLGHHVCLLLHVDGVG